MTRFSSALLASSVLSLLSFLSLLSSASAQTCDPNGNCFYNDCSCSCYCDRFNNAYCGGCGTSGGTIAGIVIAVIFAIAIILCLLSLCYRRRYYQNNYAGRTYGSGAGVPATVTTAVPMQAMAVGGYGSQQPMQAIPVQYAQYPASPGQPAYNPYGAATYAQTPVGGGQPINTGGQQYPGSASQPPAYTAYPSAPSGEGQPAPIEYPSKQREYDGERAI